MFASSLMEWTWHNVQYLNINEDAGRTAEKDWENVYGYEYAWIMKSQCLTFWMVLKNASIVVFFLHAYEKRDVCILESGEYEVFYLRVELQRRKMTSRGVAMCNNHRNFAAIRNDFGTAYVIVIIAITSICFGNLYGENRFKWRRRKRTSKWGLMTWYWRCANVK